MEANLVTQRLGKWQHQSGNRAVNSGQQQLCIKSDHSWKFRVDRLSRQSLFYFTANSGQATQLDKKRLSEHMENSPPQFVLFLQNI